MILSALYTRTCTLTHLLILFNFEASKATEILESLKDEINKWSSNSRPSSPACGCGCHDDEYDSDDSYYSEGCRWCWEDHQSRAFAYDWSYHNYGGGYEFPSNTIIIRE